MLLKPFIFTQKDTLQDIFCEKNSWIRVFIDLENVKICHEQDKLVVMELLGQGKTTKKSTILKGHFCIL